MAIDREKVAQAALKFAEKGRYDKAIAEYQRILQEDPNDPRILLKIGDWQIKLNAHQAAIDTYEKVGKLYVTQGFSLKAIAVYKQIRDIISKQAPQLEDRYAHILPKLADLFAQLGLVSDALSTYDEVAVKLLKSGRDQDATEVFRKIVAIDPNNPLPHLRLAEMLARVKDVEGSIEQFSAAADLLMKLGRRDDALKVFERLLQIRKDADFARRCALLYLDRNQGNDAMQALAKLQIAFQANQKDLETLGLLARAFEQLGQPAKAIEVKKETARQAKEQNNREVMNAVLDELLRIAPNDDQVKSLARSVGALPSSRPPPPVAPPQAARQPEVDESEMEFGEGDDLSVDEVEHIEDVEEIHDVEEIEVDEPSHARGRAKSDMPPASHVAVPHSLRAAEEVRSTDDDLDEFAFTRETLTDVKAFRLAKHYASAVESLRIALEVVPASIELREALREVLLESGEDEAAVGEMLTLATLRIDAGDEEGAARELEGVLRLVPNHYRARELLATIRGDGDYGGLEPVGPGTDAVGAIEFDEPDIVPASEHVGGIEFDEPDIIEGSQPLPSYDLEGVSAAEVLTGSQPRVAIVEPTATPQVSEQDDPFADAPGAAQQPLPSFSLEEDEPFEAGYPQPPPPRATYQAPPPALQTDAPPGFDDLDHPSEHFEVDDADAGEAVADQHAEAPPPADELDAAATPMLAGTTRAFQGGDTIEDALEEVDFFASRGLYEDARAIIEEQLTRAPNHPLLIDRLQELEEAMAEAGGSQPIAPSHSPDSLVLSENFDIDSSLDTLDAFEPTLEAKQHFSKDQEQVDVESVFAKFKEGVKTQVADNDSATHYDLGVAYKEMNLLDDAIGEFLMAARDPSRACVCHSMAGMIELERGRLDAAAKAFLDALASPERNIDQEIALYYELGNIYELKKNKPQALTYFRKIERHDPTYRDVAERIAALDPPKGGSNGAKGPKLKNIEEDFDSVFDDLLGEDKA